MSLPLGILDQSPIVSGATPREAIEATIALARRAEALGYTRYWLAEHHSMSGLADASPEVLLARLTAETSRIRLGSGGVMLPHYSAFKVAETFRMLEALAPGRIDLGVGRAPGGTSRVSAALESRPAEMFPHQITDLMDFLDGSTPPDGPFVSLAAMPTGHSSPALWVLGSSEYGALLAARMGLPYTLAHFIAGDAPEITRAYRARFQASSRCPEPRVIVAVGVIVAPTDAEAEALTWPLALWRMRLLRGHSTPVPSLEEVERYPWTARERDEVVRSRRVIAGSPATVSRRLGELVAEHAADEAMIVTITPDYASRVRSYELLANVFSAAPVAA